MNSDNTYYSILSRRWEYVWEYVTGSFMIEKDDHIHIFPGIEASTSFFREL